MRDRAWFYAPAQPVLAFVSAVATVVGVVLDHLPATKPVDPPVAPAPADEKAANSWADLM